MDLPEYSRISGLKLAGPAFADMLLVFEFLHNFGETLGFGNKIIFMQGEPNDCF